MAAVAVSKSLARQTLLSTTKEPEPLPPIWDWFWDTMPFLAAGKPGQPLTLGDVARTFKINIEQIFGSIPAPDKAPLAAADVEGLDFQALFLGMKARALSLRVRVVGAGALALARWHWRRVRQLSQLLRLPLGAPPRSGLL